MNFFVYKSVAERYAKHRPYFHPLVIEKIRAYLKIQFPVDCAVDVACGSGQSTVALKEIAAFVMGMDISAEMLGLAEQRSGIAYIQAAAERLAINDDLCDLMTTSLAYHWFDREQFFAEVKRVLKNDGWLVISNNWFTGQMNNEPGFEHWFNEVYEKRYPSPRRNSAPMDSGFAQQRGFDFAYQDEYQNEVLFTVEELAAYLITQSNVIAATEQGQERVEDVYDWLVRQIKPFFRLGTVSFVFEGYLWYLQKTS